MKKHTHPVSVLSEFICGNCGTAIAVSSTVKPNANLDTCSNCHSAYTGIEVQKASGSRIDSFNARYNK